MLKLESSTKHLIYVGGYKWMTPQTKWGNSGDAYKCMTQPVRIQYHNIGTYIFITFVIKTRNRTLSLDFGKFHEK